MTSSQFLSNLTEDLVLNAYHVQADNIDYFRFHTSLFSRIRKWLTERMLLLAKELGFSYCNSTELAHTRQRLSEILTLADQFDLVYRLLAEDESRKELIHVLAYRILGNRRKRLPVNNPQYWKAIRRINRDLLVEKRTTRVRALNGFLDTYDLRAIDFPVRLQAHLVTVLTTFLLQQYCYGRIQPAIQVEPGDVVIDGGGCWGDTALYCAHKAGEGGRVYCFEFVPGNLAILRKNLSLNPHLNTRIHVMEEALWHHSGESLAYSDWGPGTSFFRSQVPEAAARTRAIDDLVAETGLSRVDFIKLDIEGAELEALHGAEKTLRAFRPKLAISVYHSLAHFLEIPRFLNGLKLGYAFHLRHCTIHEEETILFARSQGVVGEL